MAFAVYERITQEIIAKLERGTVPWHRPWIGGPEGAPANLISKKRYRGINSFLLTFQPYNSPFWLTYKQAVQFGGNVRRGEKATLVVFWKWLETGIKEIRGEVGTKPVRVVVLRYYHVFNVEQCEGVEYPKPVSSAGPARQVKPIEAAEKIVAGFPNAPRIEHQGTQALYRPGLDLILMPQRESFERDEGYYSTLFHELTHSTGHEKRLGRNTLADVSPFGSTNYSKEELVAEMGAAMLCGEAGIENSTIENSASYIAGWLKKLKDDSRLVIVAAGQAQRAADHILGRQYEEVEQPESVSVKT